MPGVGAVGPKLLFDDGSIQHAGLFFQRDPDGMWLNAHYHKGMPRAWPQGCARRRVPGVTGAALLVRPQAVRGGRRNLRGLHRRRLRGFRFLPAAARSRRERPLRARSRAVPFRTPLNRPAPGLHRHARLPLQSPPASPALERHHRSADGRMRRRSATSFGARHDRYRHAARRISAATASCPCRRPNCIFIGDGDYRAIGAEFLERLVRDAGPQARRPRARHRLRRWPAGDADDPVPRRRQLRRRGPRRRRNRLVRVQHHPAVSQCPLPPPRPAPRTLQSRWRTRDRCARSCHSRTRRST